MINVTLIDETGKSICDYEYYFVRHDKELTWLLKSNNSLIKYTKEENGMPVVQRSFLAQHNINLVSIVLNEKFTALAFDF